MAPAPKQETFLVRVVKTPAMKTMGMDLRYKAKGAVKVREVFEDGLVAAWNRENKNFAVYAGDSILAVNGREGKPEDLVRILAESNEVELRIKPASKEVKGSSAP